MKRKFVTAEVFLGTKIDIIQGIMVAENAESIFVVGLKGAWKCKKNYTVVPLKELYGQAEQLAKILGVTND